MLSRLPFLHQIIFVPFWKISRAYTCKLISVLLICLAVIALISHCLDYSSSKLSLKYGSINPPNLFLIFKMIFGYSGHFLFPYAFWNQAFIFYKISLWRFWKKLCWRYKYLGQTDTVTRMYISSLFMSVVFLSNLL